MTELHAIVVIEKAKCSGVLSRTVGRLILQALPTLSMTLYVAHEDLHHAPNGGFEDGRTLRMSVLALRLRSG